MKWTCGKENTHNGRVKLVQELDETRTAPAEPPQGPQATAGTSTVVCTVSTRHQSLNNNGCHQLVQELHLWDLDGVLNSSTVGTTSPKHNREVQHFVDELNRGTSKEMGSRLAQAASDNSLAEPYSSLQGLRECVDADHAVSRVPLLAVGSRSLWAASPGDTSEHPFSDRSLGRRPSVALFQRGSALLSHSVSVFIDFGCRNCGCWV